MAKSHMTILNHAKQIAMKGGLVTPINRCDPVGYRISREQLERIFLLSGWKPRGTAAKRAISTWISLDYVYHDEMDDSLLLLCDALGEWPL